MSFDIKTIEVQSTDNIHTLKGLLYIPVGEIKGIVHIIHGMCEYIGRYSHVFSALAEEGYLCCGYDNLGHGNTARDSEELGFIANNDGWKYLISDVAAFEDAIKKLYPGKPIYLFGHSMGSFIARMAAEGFRGNYEKLIICGTGGTNPATPFGLLATNIFSLIKGKKYRSDFIINLAFSGYNKRFTGESQNEWISTDKSVVAKYDKDPFCIYKFTVSAMHDLIKLNQLANRKGWYKALRKDLPILLIAGTEDPVGNYGKGVTEVYKKLKASGNENLTLKLYENCRHEIHNDSCRNQVFEDIIEFIK